MNGCIVQHKYTHLLPEWHVVHMRALEHMASGKLPPPARVAEAGAAAPGERGEPFAACCRDASRSSRRGHRKQARHAPSSGDKGHTIGSRVSVVLRPTGARRERGHRREPCGLSGPYLRRALSHDTSPKAPPRTADGKTCSLSRARGRSGDKPRRGATAGISRHRCVPGPCAVRLLCLSSAGPAGQAQSPQSPLRRRRMLRSTPLSAAGRRGAMPAVDPCRAEQAIVYCASRPRPPAAIAVAIETGGAPQPARVPERAPWSGHSGHRPAAPVEGKAQRCGETDERFARNRRGRSSLKLLLTARR